MLKIKYFDAVIWLELLFINSKFSYSKNIKIENNIIDIKEKIKFSLNLALLKNKKIDAKIIDQNFIEKIIIKVKNFIIFLLANTRKTIPKKIIKSKLNLSNNNKVEGLKIAKKYIIKENKLAGFIKYKTTIINEIIKINGNIKKKKNLNFVMVGNSRNIEPYTWILFKGSQGFSKKTFIPWLSHFIALTIAVQSPNKKILPFETIGGTISNNYFE